MKLQLALDDISTKNAISLLDKIHPFIDIIELGTPYLLKNGLSTIKEFKNRYPTNKILCDTKIIDGGALESEMTLSNGADYLTVLGISDIETIKECIAVTKKYNKQLVIDMICITKFKEYVNLFENMSADILAIHTGVDQQRLGRTPLDDLKEVSLYKKDCKISVAGGINSNNIDKYISLNPDIIIVGGGIIQSKNPIEETKKISYKIRSFTK